MKPSIIREILKQMSDPELISFAGGNPAAESFPAEEIRKYSDMLLEKDPVGTLQYSITEGYPPLRKSAEEFVNRRWLVKKDSDELIITSGSQQIMDFAAHCLCNEGDIVACEEMAFLGAFNAFRSYGAELRGVPNTADGVLDLEKLEEIFAAPQKPKFFYVIPNFQNPTGLTMPLEIRKGVYELSVKYGVPVLEDDPYGELRFEGEPIMPIKALDTEGAVIYACSFSKIMCPGMRIAFSVAPKELTAKMVIAKQCCDVHSNVWAQRVCHEILTNVDMDSHIARLQKIYGEKVNLMLSEMEKHFDKRVRYTRPQGGMFIWATLPDGADMPAFVSEALKNKVAVVPGNAFCADDTKPCQSFRLNFSTAPAGDIIKGIKILGDLTKKYCENA